VDGVGSAGTDDDADDNDDDNDADDDAGDGGVGVCATLIGTTCAGADDADDEEEDDDEASTDKDCAIVSLPTDASVDESTFAIRGEAVVVVTTVEGGTS
jgi:hypothetical protein